MMRWSPMSKVSSMEPEGMTRAWPSVPLMSMKARMTQNQAMISLFTFTLMGTSGSFAEAFLFFTFVSSAFTIHHHSFRRFVGLGAFADFELHEVGGIDAGVAGGAERAVGITDRAAKAGEREIAERIGAEKFANLLGRFGRGDELFFCGRIHAVVAGRDGG